MAEILAFAGSDFHSGTTMVAQSVSEALGGSGKKVIFLSLSGYSGTEYTNLRPESIDEIKNNLVNGLLNYNDIKNLIRKSGTFDIIGGSVSPLYYRHYQPVHVNFICDLIIDDYDYIIIDAGADVNQGLHIGALRKAGKTVIVTTQSKKAYERYLNKYRQVYSMMEFHPLILINRYINTPGLLSSKDIEGMYNAETAGVIPFCEYGLQAETGEYSLMKYRSFSEAVARLCEKITGEKIMPYKNGLFGKRKQV